jgi:hypothetical protein
MTRTKILLVTTCAALALAAGLAFAQGPTPFPRPDREVIAAQDALQEAMEHLARARSPNAVQITRAKAYIALAHTELVDAGGVQGLNRSPE